MYNRICDDFVISIYVVVGVSILIAKRWRDCCFFFFLRFISFETFVFACEYDYEYMLQKKIPMHNNIHDGLAWLGSNRLDEWEPNAKENVYYEIKTNLNWYCFYSRFRQPERSRAFVLFAWFVLCFRFFLLSLSKESCSYRANYT